MKNEFSKTEILRALRSETNETKEVSRTVSIVESVKALLRKLNIKLLEAKFMESQLEIEKQKIRVSFYF